MFEHPTDPSSRPAQNVRASQQSEAGGPIRTPVSPDDLIPPGRSGFGGSEGPDQPDDGNFKRGRFLPLILLALLAAAGGAAVFFGVKQDEKKLSVAEIASEKKSIFVLPQKDQAPRWREWAKSGKDVALEQEALAQLAWAEDPEGVTLAIQALRGTDHRVKGVAAQAIAYFGSPAADAAKPALLEALKIADESDRPQIVWALVTLKEKAAFDMALDQYRKGNLSKVERLGGGLAFDPEKLASVVSLDELAKLATDPSPSVRQLVATLLSKNAEPKWTSVLVTLVRDKDVEVGREAANGLGRIADESARTPLVEALSSADKDSRQKFLEALRDGIGGEGLVLALGSVKIEPAETAWFQTNQIFQMLRGLADPRMGDALVHWVESKNPPLHWRAEAGLRLAEVGDIRGAKYIADRMRADPTQLYKLENFWEADEGGHLSRTDLQRVVGARMLADLATMYPTKNEELKVAEEAVLHWITDRPQPHANGLRYLAQIGSAKALPHMREWAFPTEELPKEGQQGHYPQAFETAQSALMYLGWMKDDASFTKLTDQFKRKKDKKMDITQAGLEGAGLSMLAMSLRAVAVGAADGLAQWGDSRAVKPLTDLIEDPTWHEEAREAACRSLAWVADDKAMADVARKTRDFAGKKDARSQFIGACYATTLTLRPVPAIVPDLVDLLSPTLELGVRPSVARAIGVSGFDAATESKLFAKLADPEIRNSAALALIMGGNSETARRAVALYADFPKEALDELKDQYYRAFGYWSDEDLKRGNLYRWVDNAEAISRIKVNDVPQEWAKQRLQAQFDNLQFFNGPHSETRVVLRYRLREAAKSGDAAASRGAIQTLKFMKEKGTLMALRHEPGQPGELARRAFHELMNPKVVAAEDLRQLQAKDAAAAKTK